ncbi:MAG TPA: polysaccharide deacetylase family protein [Allosphingosinicella sp.]
MTGGTELISEDAGRGAGRLDRPPPPGAYIDLPESFGRRFAIFVDTEEEFDWSKPPTRDQHGTSAAESLPKVHRRLREAGVQPAYLIDWPIASDLRCVATLRDYVEGGECAVGTQLHPWVNPPFDEELSRINSFAGNLPEALERAKLLRLTAKIEEGFGRRPIVYRAGRYGVGPNTARLLAEAGYEADASVRPLHDYSREGGPDFSGFEPRPFRVGGLVELPLTVAYTGRLRRLGRPLYGRAGRVPRARGVLARAGLLSRIALTPEGMPLAEAKEAAERLLGDGLRLFSISFHSPSVEPGHTPYVRDEADLASFYRWWDGMFDLFARHGVEPASLEEILAATRAAACVGAPEAGARP